MQINHFNGYADNADWRLILKRHQSALTAYLSFGDPVEPFLTAILTNDLIGAARAADDADSKRLYDYADFLHNYADRRAYGSPEKVREWITGHGALGILRMGPIK